MKAIIFDFDGVIHNTFELAYGINTEVLGKNLSREEYRDFFNGNIYERVEISKESSGQFFEKQNEAFKFLKVEEKIKSVLEKLANDYSLFIISSNQEKALNTYFRNNNFVHIFKDILGEETHRSKVEKFKLIFKEYKLSSKDCLFVTDTLGDILEANKVGVRTIAVDFGFHDKKRLEKGNPFKIISSFEEILNIVE